MSRRFSIRAAAAGDAPALAALHGRCFPDAPWSASMVADSLNGGEGLTAARGDLLAGLALFRVAAGEAEIMSFCVAPEARGEGLGAALLEALLATARASACDAVYLDVAADNRPAQALYARAGFAVVGRRRAYYRSGADARILRRAF